MEKNKKFENKRILIERLVSKSQVSLAGEHEWKQKKNEKMNETLLNVSPHENRNREI